MASGLASIIGGLAQGITDFGKSAADMFGGAATNNALTVGLDALLNKKSLGQASADARQRQNDYRKWLYDTDSAKDAAAKGLGTALNGAQAVMDFVPGIGQSAPVNALQGAIGGLADEFKFNGENYDLGRAAGRAAIGAGANVAAGGLGKALANSGSKVLSNGVLRGAAAGGLSGAISQGGNAAIEGGNADQILQSAAQGAKFGALMGAGTGGVQTLAGALKNARARNSAPAIMDEEVVMAEMAPDYQSRIAQAQAEIENIGPVSLFAKDAESQAKRARIMELNDNIKAWQNGYENAGDYSAAHEAKRANRKPYEAPEAKYQPRIGETTLDAAPAQEGYTRLYRGLENDFDPKYLPSVDDNPFGYESWTDNYNLAKQYGNNVYSVDVPTSRIADQIVTANGERVPVVKTAKKAGLNGVDGVEYMLNANDPLRQELEYRRIVGAPEQKTVADIANEPKTYYHGSPETDITSFDINRAGKNTRSGEKAIYFTDTPEAAEEFAYERIPTDSNFIDKAGKRGGVYEVNLDMRNTLDLDNLTDAQIKELWPYASYMGSWQGEDVFARDIKKWRDVKNPQLIKGYLDLEKLANSPYDSFSATMYPNTGNTAKEYGIFDASKAKIIKTPNAATEVMAERVAPGQLGLFDQTTTKAPETGYSQLGLFDQPTQPVTPKTIDVADVNPYAPVNGEVTQTMRDRAADIMKNYEKGLPENELYNRINPETMPTNGIDVIARQADGLKPKARKEYITRALFGNKNIEDATMDELFDVYYADNPQRRASMEAKIQQVRDANYYGPEVKNTIIENTRKNFVKNVKTAINKASEATSSRNGFTGAADAVLSERLGIAPGNTNKRQLRHDSDKTTYGRYRPDAKEISITEKFPTPENAISTMAHERLHSFQHEADAQGGRYAEDVKNAYKELQKDLLPLLHGRSRIRKDHARNLDYYGSRIEQESRMLQDYLDQKGYTDSKRFGRGEYGEEINPAFDKFFDKLRELSKKGVALPAILAALGLGGYATQNQEEDKDNGQQI